MGQSFTVIACEKWVRCACNILKHHSSQYTSHLCCMLKQYKRLKRWMDSVHVGLYTCHHVYLYCDRLVYIPVGCLLLLSTLPQSWHSGCITISHLRSSVALDVQVMRLSDPEWHSRRWTAEQTSPPRSTLQATDFRVKDKRSEHTENWYGLSIEYGKMLFKDFLILIPLLFERY